MPVAASKENGAARFSAPGAVAGELDDVYVAGQFTMAGGIAASNIAHWTGSNGSWGPLGAGVSGGTSPVRALVLAGTDLFVGGDFTQTAVVSTTHIPSKPNELVSAST